MTTQPAADNSKSWRKGVFRAGAWVIGIYLALAGFVMLTQRSLYYLPSRAASLPPPAGTLPQAHTVSISVTAADGLTLHGWQMTSTAPQAAPREKRPVIIYFCGNAGNRSYRIEEFDLLTRLGCDVLCFDYRGYGDNGGETTEENLAADAHAIWKYATNELHISPSRLVLFGESLGGAVATRLAARLCAAGTQIAGLIVRSTFTSLADVGKLHYPWLPVRLLLLDRFEAIDKIAQVTCPILVVHGRFDTIVPFALGRQLFDAAPATSANGIPKTFAELPRANHNDVLEADGALLTEALRTFFDSIR
jgi:uncharacterized protein